MSKPSTIDRAKTQLIVRHPFFASILLRRPIKETTDVPTAGIDRRGTIYYNPDFVENLSVENCIFLLAHEVMHWTMQTFPRQGSRDPKGWNYATDAVNNEMLVEAGVGEFIEGGVRWHNAQNMTAEQVYDELPKDENGKPQPGDIGGTGEDLHDTGEDGPMTEAEAKEIQAQVAVEVAQAAQVAKMSGKMPGALQRLVDEILHPKTPWYTILERFMTERVKNDYSWARPNRRHVGNDIYLPSLDGQGMGEVALIVDTSGSVSPRELQAFAGHINVILETCHPKQVHVVYVDTRVSHVDTYSGDELPIHINPQGGGGTDMSVGIDYVDTHYPEAACQVLLTDGYTPWPDAAAVPLIVATTGREAPDHLAQTIKVDPDE